MLSLLALAAGFWLAAARPDPATVAAEIGDANANLPVMNQLGFEIAPDQI